MVGRGGPRSSCETLPRPRPRPSLQASARANGVAIDSLEFEFPVLTPQDEAAALSTPPKEGAFVSGLFLEGARWDGENACLAEPEPMQLFSPMPAVHFKPREVIRDKGRGVYKCPLFSYPVRTGTRERPSFVVPVDLRTEVSAEHWVRRGTALLLSLAF